MSLVTIQPGGAAQNSPVIGWNFAIPTPAGLSQAALDAQKIIPIGGVKGNPANICADSPPTGMEIYVITGLRIAYSTIWTIDSTTTETFNITTELALLKASEVLYSQEDTEGALALGAGPTTQSYAGSGIVTADLINPLTLREGETLQLRVGTYNQGGASAPAQLSWVVGALLAGAADGSGDFQRSSSTISYQTLVPAKQNA